LAKKNQYKNLIPLYDSLLSKHPSLQFPEGNFNNLGLQLIFNPASSKEGINIFKLAVHLFPGSANLYDSLGEAYLFIGDKKNAIISFEKSLSLYSENQNAINRLNQLK
jgi:tetratricopeptide (TPR) repeat protein